MSIYTIIAKVLGILLLLLWLVFIPLGRYWFRRMRGLMYATVFQWHILPFIVGVGLITSGKLLVIIVLPIAWILSIFFPNSLLLFFPWSLAGLMVVSYILTFILTRNYGTL